MEPENYNPFSTRRGRGQAESPYDESAVMTTGARGLVSDFQRADAAAAKMDPLKERQTVLTQRKTQIGYAKQAAEQLRDKFLATEGADLFEKDPTTGKLMDDPLNPGKPLPRMEREIESLRSKSQEKVGLIRGALTTAVAGEFTADAKAAAARLTEREPLYKAQKDKWDRIQEQLDRIKVADEETELELGQIATARLNRDGVDLLGAPNLQQGSSVVERQAHNPVVAGSTPAPAPTATPTPMPAAGTPVAPTATQPGQVMPAAPLAPVVQITPAQLVVMHRRLKDAEAVMGMETTAPAMKEALRQKIERINDLLGKGMAALPTDQLRQRVIEHTGPLAGFESLNGGKTVQTAKAVARGATAEGIFAGGEGLANLARNIVTKSVPEVINWLEELRDMRSGLSPQDVASRKEERAKKYAGRSADLETDSKAVRGLKDYADTTSLIRRNIRTALEVDQDFAQSLQGQVAQGAGQMVGTIASGAAGGPAAIAGMSIGQIYDEAFQDAKASGADDNTAHSAAMKYLPAAGLDFLSDQLIVGKLLKPLKGKVKVRDVLKDVLVSGAAEGVTEGAQQAYLNQVAKRLEGYDPDREFDQEVYDSVLVGAIVGGGVTAVGSGVRKLAEPKDQPPDAGTAAKPGQPTAPMPDGVKAADAKVYPTAEAAEKGDDGEAPKPVLRFTFEDKAGQKVTIEGTGLKDARSKLPKEFKPDMKKTRQEEAPKPDAPAEFLGIEGEGSPKAFESYRLTTDIPGHVKGSSVSRQTLEEAGFNVPARPGAATPETLAGDKISNEWTAFSPESQSLGIPRADMPQVKAEHRGALTQFLKAKGIASTEEQVLPGDLKPTQAEFSQAKVDKAREFTGGDRAILVSADGHVVDGHHQWMAKLTDKPGEPMRVIRLDAPIEDLLQTVKEFPSAEASKGATTPGNTSQPPANTRQSTSQSVTPESGPSQQPGAGASGALPQATAPAGKPSALPGSDSGAGSAPNTGSRRETAPPRAPLSLVEKRAAEVYRRIRAQNPKATDKTWIGQADEQSQNPSRYHKVVEDENPKGLRIGDTVTTTDKKTGEKRTGIVVTVEKTNATAYAGGYQVKVALPNEGEYGGFYGIDQVEKAGPDFPSSKPKQSPPVVERGKNTPAAFTKAVTAAAKNKAGDKASKAVASWAKVLHNANPRAFADMEVHTLSQADWDAHPAVGQKTPDSAGAYDPDTNTLYINADKSSGEQIVNTIVHEGGHFAEKYYLGEDFVQREWEKLLPGQRVQARHQYAWDDKTGRDPINDKRARSEWVAMQVARVVKGQTEGMSKGLVSKLEKFLRDVRELVNRWIGDGALTTKALDAKILEMLGYTEPKPDKHRLVGKNSEGQNVYEDDRGARHVEQVPNILVSEPVGLVPTRGANGGIQYLPEVRTAERRKGTPFETVEEREAAAKPASPQPRPEPAVVPPAESAPVRALKNQVTGAIERGEKEPVVGKPAAPTPKTMDDEIRQAFDGLLGTPADNAQQGIPSDRRPAFLNLAEKMLAAGITTPETMAAKLDTVLEKKARKFSQSLWNAFGMVRPELSSQPDWNAIYGAIDKPAQKEEVSPREQQPVSPAAPPDAQGATNPRVVGSQQPEEGKRVEGGRQPENAPDRGRGPGEQRARESGRGRDDASQRPGEVRDLRGSKSESRVTSAGNYVITPDDQIGAGGLKTKYRDNIAAIKLLKQITAENRPATVAEQRILVRYVGWGGMKSAFNPNSKDWAKEFKELKDLLTEDEYKAARRSVLDAHYTSETVITKGIYAAMQRFGFMGGKMVEGGVGVGHFIGLMPASLRGPSSYLGVEKDPTTARIAQLLYPESRILNQGFEDSNLAPGTFDASVGNPPFGETKLYDKRFKEASKHSIHNFFILKQLELLRPGGVAGFVVSRYFLDTQSTLAREAIAAKAEFLGAIRLPNTAFKQNANTEVTTDLVFFRRVPDGQKTKQDWVTSVQVKDEASGKEYSINGWLNARPEMMLGKMELTGSMYSDAEPTLSPRPNQDLGADLTKAVESLPQNVYQPGDAATTKRLSEPNPLPAGSVPTDAKVGGYFLDDNGELHVRLPDVNEERRSAPVANMKEGTAARVKAIIPVRTALNRLVKAEFDAQSTDERLNALRASLNKAYDAFVAKFGYLNQQANRRAFYDDPESARLLGLESNFDPGVSAMVAKKQETKPREPSAQKAAIFTKRVNAPYTEVTSVETAKEALAVSLNQRGEVDIEYMAQLSGKQPKEVIDDLGGLIYPTPRGGYQSKEQYLSGNVRQKLQEAKVAFNQTQDPQWKRNIEDLEKVIPADIPAVDISAPVGAPWVPAEDVAQFAREITERAPNTVLYRKYDGGWLFEHQDNSVASTQTYGTSRASFGEIFKNLLNGRPTLVYDKDSDDKPVLNQQETALAGAKAEEIKAKWEEWIWKDQERRERLARFYNDNFNNYVDPRYDGSHLTLPGANPAIQLRQHQKNVVWRTITDRRALYDHVVGAGKTFAGVASFMEMKRMGRVRKPLFVVPNHLTQQWKDDFLKLYPSANVLATQPADFDKDSRAKLFAKILTGEYDAVIIGHSQFKKIGVSPEIERQLLNEMVGEISEAIEAMKAAEGKRGRSSRPVAQAEKTKERLEERLKKLAEVGERDTAATFEELGIDGLFVDEAHEFKNLFYTTQMQRVAGLGNAAGSQKAFDLYLKTRYLRQRFAGKAPLVFATGTPISNSLVEMFTMQRYLQGEVIEEMGLKSLDAWAKVFGEVAHVYEVDPTGTGYRMATRLAQFQNVGELSAIYRTVADVITMTDLEEQAQVRGERFPVPKIKGGKPTNYVAERTKEQTEYFGVERQEVDEAGNPKFDAQGNPIVSYPEGTILYRVDNMPKDPRIDNMLKLTNDARKAGLDMRLIDPSMPDRPESKVNKAVTEIVDVYNKWEADKGTQLVFCDLSVPASARGKATKKAREQADQFYFRSAVVADGKTELQPIENAKPVEIEGFKEFQFFTYKNERGNWLIVEKSTGKSIGVSESTMKAAIEAAPRRLANVKNFAEIIKNNAQPEELVAQARGEWMAAQEAAKAESETEQPEGEQGISVDELLADQSSFSVYDDMKAKLIAAGIPENEIAFIHDYDSPDKKAKLFKAMNAGTVRVLFGSTPKLGAGTNVQERLVALHHLDAPWRPSDLEQREGRIVRQGNKLYLRDPDGFEVTINRYATKQTYDTRMWQILEHKARGIEGFRKADRSTRRIADVSGEAANASDMKAAASGDPLIQREIELRNERQKLELLRKAWTSNRHELQGRAKWLRDADDRHKSAVDLANERIAARQAKPDPFTFTKADGTVHEGKDGIAAVVAEAVKKAAAPDNLRRSSNLGSYRGFDFDVNYTSGRGLSGFIVYARPIGKNGNWEPVTNYSSEDSISDTGFVQRVDNWLDGFDDKIETADRVLADEKKRLAETEAELAKPFAQEAQLVAVREEHEKTRTELLNKKKQAVAPAPTQPPAQQGPLGTPPVTGTPEQERILNKVTGTLEDKRTFTQKIGDYLADLGGFIAHELQQKVLDRFAAVKRLERETLGTNEIDASTSAYKWSRLTHNLPGVMEYLLRHGQIAYRAGSMEMVPETKGLIDILKPVVDSGKLRLWEGYVAAFRANRLLAEGKEKNFGKFQNPQTGEWEWDAGRAQEEINALLELGKDHPEFEQVRQDYVTFQKSVLDMATAAGLIDPAKRAMWERSDYVPFYRIVEALDNPKDAKGPAKRRGFSGQSAGIRQLKGGPQQVAILENIFRNIEQMVDASFKNIAMQRIADLAGDNTDLLVKIPYKAVPFKATAAETVQRLEEAGVDVDSLSEQELNEVVTFWRMRAPEGKDIVSVMNQGKPVYYRVKDRPLLRSILALGPDRHALWMRMLMAPRKALTTLVTLDPAFMAANTIRDSFSAWVISDSPIKPGWDSMRGLVKSLKDDPVKLSIMVNGGGTGHYNNMRESEVRRAFLRMTREQQDGFKASIIDTPAKLFRVYRDIGRATENANRIAIADSAAKRGASPAEAAFQALDIMDFGLRGDSALIGFFLDTVPFLNARIQGLYRLGRGIINDPKRVATHGAIIMGASLALLAANWEDERYWDLPEWDRDLYYHFWVGDRHIRIPKPFEVGQIFSTIPERFAQVIAKDGDGRVFGRRMLNILDQTFLQGSFYGVPVPQVVKPMLDVKMNQSSLTGGRIVSAGDAFKKPEDQYNAFTSETVRELAKAAPEMAPEWMKSPKQLEYLIRGYFGTLGTYAMDASDAIVRRAANYPEKPASKFGDYWVTKRFSPESDLRDSKFVSEFYELNQDIGEVMAKVKSLREAGDTAEANEIVQENRDMIAYAPVAHSTAKALSAIRRRERDIHANPRGMSPEQRREELARLAAQRNALTKRTVQEAPGRPEPFYNPFRRR